MQVAGDSTTLFILSFEEQSGQLLLGVVRLLELSNVLVRQHQLEFTAIKKSLCPQLEPHFAAVMGTPIHVYKVFTLAFDQALKAFENDSRVFAFNAGLTHF